VTAADDERCSCDDVSMEEERSKGAQSQPKKRCELKTQANESVGSVARSVSRVIDERLGIPAKIGRRGAISIGWQIRRG
jgi:hypothetical protein